MELSSGNSLSMNSYWPYIGSKQLQAAIRNTLVLFPSKDTVGTPKLPTLCAFVAKRGRPICPRRCQHAALYAAKRPSLLVFVALFMRRYAD